MLQCSDPIQHGIDSIVTAASHFSLQWLHGRWDKLDGEGTGAENWRGPTVPPLQAQGG